ncbi:serine/threonine-protein kinase [Streptomyces mirabilis]|uniref:serine/threonine-protein kinase n=1 Tax=Streptomyces mirabilis TaxID=68239 RepID=UPI0036D9EA14
MTSDPAATPSVDSRWTDAIGPCITGQRGPTTVLSYAHDVPVIHRDLKPGNILVARDGTVKVLDFGIAAIPRTDVTKLTATGSPHRHPPVHAARAGPWRTRHPGTDLYALGCVLHELLSGRAMFEAESEYLLMYQHVNAAPTPLRQLRPDVPEALEELVLHLLRKAPEARPADRQEVYARLLPFLPPPGGEPGMSDAGPAGAPDATGVFRHPFAPRARTQAPAPGVRGRQPSSRGPSRCPSPPSCARTSRRRTPTLTPCLRRSRHAARSRPHRGGRPRTVRSIRALVLRTGACTASYSSSEWKWPQPRASSACSKR